MVILRAGLYERVSTDEQIKGLSINTQIANLEEYCKENKIKIVGHYTDAGVSGGKAYSKRPEMSRLLDDVKAGKIDIILFTKLDRWFRNIKEYYKVQEILELNGAGWKAIQEDYDTTTSDGRLKLNIYLSIAQNEREKGSDRIKVVFDHKLKNGELTTGSLPRGYMKYTDENGKLKMKKDPATQEILQTFWDEVKRTENITGSGRYTNNLYNIKWTKKTWFDIAKSDFYTGTHRGVKNYCEPYIDFETWERLQSRRIKDTPTGRVYLFTGLLKCPVCGKNLTSAYSRQQRANGEYKEYKYYRCRHREVDICNNNSAVYESTIESFLLENFQALVERETAKAEIAKAAPKKKPKSNIPALKERLRRIEVVYLAGNKSDDEYLKETAEIKELIAKAENEIVEEETVDIAGLQEILQADFKTLYDSFDMEARRKFWRSIIKEIKTEKTKVVDVIFF